MAIVDPNFVDGMPKGLTSASGIDALVHAFEAYVSNMATNFLIFCAALLFLIAALRKLYHPFTKG